MASSSDFNAGANPPSSPTDVASPLSFKIAANAWNTSAHHRLPGFHFIDSINHWNREDKDQL